MQWIRTTVPVVVAAVVAAALVGAPAAHADITVDSAVCLNTATGTLTLANPGVTWPDLPVLGHTANLPSACSGANGQLVLTSGVLQAPVLGASQAVPAPGVWTLRLRTSLSEKVLSVLTVDRVLPAAQGAPMDVTIVGNDLAQRRTFAAAVQTKGSTVRVAGTVNLDLSGLEALPVADHVQILGDQSVVRSGPRLFTTTFPARLLTVGTDAEASNGVRISGIRLDGGMSDDPYTAVDKPDANGIVVYGSAVEIDHSELYHWRGAAVSVFDGNGANSPSQTGRLNQANAHDMWVHDNYIHHNQHPSSADCGLGGGHASGYGVATFYGAYATIERNVFDYNRHSIAGDGRYGTGYFAKDNLILQHGGIHIKCQADTDSLIGFLGNPFRLITWVGVRIASSDGIYHTHAIDMHGRDSCTNINDLNFGEYNCGLAGEYMELSYNTVLYTAGNGIHLRGAPALGTNPAPGTRYGMYLFQNVFAHSVHDGGFVTPGAVVLNQGGFDETATTLGLNTFDDRKYCDFDGDLVQDPFIATGATWWYSSSQLGGRWVFLNRSPARVSAISLSDVDGDRRCDATSGGQTVLNPGPYPLALSPGNLSTTYNATIGLDLLASGGARPYLWSVTGLPSGLWASSTGRISGHATGAPASTVTAVVTDAAGRSSTTTFTWTLTASVPDVRTYSQAAARSTLTAAGLTSTVSTVESCLDPGTVLSQNPGAGTAVPVGSQVRINVSVCPPGHDPF